MELKREIYRAFGDAVGAENISADPAEVSDPSSYLSGKSPARDPRTR
ncbi:MAG: hypothetical protein ABID71_04775 [Chloroflexota bacterium]